MTEQAADLVVTGLRKEFPAPAAPLVVLDGVDLTLAAGQELKLTYSYDVIDDNGGVTPTTVTLTIEGRNDAPVMESSVQSCTLPSFQCSSCTSRARLRRSKKGKL